MRAFETGSEEPWVLPVGEQRGQGGGQVCRRSRSSKELRVEDLRTHRQQGYVQSIGFSRQ